MEDEAFILSNDGKSSEVEDCPKVLLELDRPLTLNDLDDYGPKVRYSFCSIDDFSYQEEPPDEVKHL